MARLLKNLAPGEFANFLAKPIEWRLTLRLRVDLLGVVLAFAR